LECVNHRRRQIAWHYKCRRWCSITSLATSQGKSLCSPQVLHGLDYLHADCGLIHTDLKPENVMLRHALRPRPVHAAASAAAAQAAPQAGPLPAQAGAEAPAPAAASPAQPSPEAAQQVMAIAEHRTPQPLFDGVRIISTLLLPCLTAMHPPASLTLRSSPCTHARTLPARRPDQSLATNP